MYESDSRILDSVVSGHKQFIIIANLLLLLIQYVTDHTEQEHQIDQLDPELLITSKGHPMRDHAHGLLILIDTLLRIDQQAGEQHIKQFLRQHNHILLQILCPHNNAEIVQDHLRQLLRIYHLIELELEVDVLLHLHGEGVVFGGVALFGEVGGFAPAERT